VSEQPTDANARSIRVVVADDDGVVRSGLRTLLDAEEDLQVVGEAGDADAARRFVRDRHPAVLVLGLSSGERGLPSIEELRGEFPETQIVVLTMEDDPALARKAMRSGALDHVVRKAADEELVETVRIAASEDLHPGFAAKPSVEWSSGKDQLTEREREVLRLIALGHTNSEMAEQLDLSVRTVETHRAHVQQKLGLASRAELVRYALDNGLIRM
jgi:two-component system response regulator NreC